MLTELLVGATVYIVTGYTDMRKGIDGLAQIVEGSVGKDAYSKAVYLFCGRSNTKMKALVWDGDGFLLLYKRLDNGRYRWPRTECEAKQLTSQQLRWLFSDSFKGASASAVLYFLVVRAKMNGLNAEDHLVRLFRSTDPVLPYETT